MTDTTGSGESPRRMAFHAEWIAVESAPTAHGVHHEFGTVVEAHIVRRPLSEGQAIQDIDDTIGVDGTINLCREGFAAASPKTVRFSAITPDTSRRDSSPVRSRCFWRKCAADCQMLWDAWRHV